MSDRRDKINRIRHEEEYCIRLERFHCVDNTPYKRDLLVHVLNTGFS